MREKKGRKTGDATTSPLLNFLGWCFHDGGKTMGSYLSSGLSAWRSFVSSVISPSVRQNGCWTTRSFPRVRSGNKRHRYKIRLSDATAFQKIRKPTTQFTHIQKGSFRQSANGESSRAAYIRRMASIAKLNGDRLHCETSIRKSSPKSLIVSIPEMLLR